MPWPTGKKPTQSHKDAISKALKGVPKPVKPKPVVFTEEVREKIADSKRGKKRSPETIRKLSKAAKGRKGPWKGKQLPAETRRKISASLKGQEVSEEARQNIAVSSTGRKHSPETIEKMREARRGKPGTTTGRKLPELQKRRIAIARLLKRFSEQGLRAWVVRSELKICLLTPREVSEILKKGISPEALDRIILRTVKRQKIDNLRVEELIKNAGLEAWAEQNKINVLVLYYADLAKLLKEGNTPAARYAIRSAVNKRMQGQVL